MSKDSLQEMYRVVNDIKTGDDAMRSDAYKQVRTAYIALLKDASVDFGQLSQSDLYIMQHYALRSHENLAADFSIKAASVIIGTTQAVKESVEFMANPVAIAQSVAERVTHPGTVLDQVESTIVHPWDTYKGNTMPQRLALAQQLESAESEIGLQATLAKEVVNSTINVLSMAAGAAGIAGKMTRAAPVGRTAITTEVLTEPPAIVKTAAPIVGATADGEAVAPVTDRLITPNPHAQLPAVDAGRLSEKTVTLANNYLAALADVVDNPIQNSELAAQQQLSLQTSKKSIQDHLSDMNGLGMTRQQLQEWSVVTAAIEKQELLISMKAPAEASVRNMQHLIGAENGAYDQRIRVAIVDMPNEGPWVMKMRKEPLSENKELKATIPAYEKVSPEAVLKLVNAQQFLTIDGLEPFLLADNQRLVASLKELTKDQVSSLSAASTEDASQAKAAQVPGAVSPHAEFTAEEVAGIPEETQSAARDYLNALKQHPGEGAQSIDSQTPLADAARSYHEKIAELRQVGEREVSVAAIQAHKSAVFTDLTEPGELDDVLLRAHPGHNEQVRKGIAAERFFQTVEEKAVLISTNAPEGAKVSKVAQMLTSIPVNQEAAVDPTKLIRSGEDGYRHGYYTMYVVETPGQSAKVLLASDVPVAHVHEPEVAEALGWGPTFSGNSRATYAEITPQKAVDILDGVNTGPLTYQTEDTVKLLRSLARTAENFSAIRPENSQQTLTDAVAHLESPEARATVLEYIAAVQSKRDAADQQQQV